MTDQQEVLGEIVYPQYGAFVSAMIKATNVLLPNGDRRDAYPSGDGTPDTFFSIPAYVYYKGKRVYGYVSPDTSVYGNRDVKFIPYTYRKHWRLVTPLPEGSVWDDDYSHS